MQNGPSLEDVSSSSRHLGSAKQKINFFSKSASESRRKSLKGLELVSLHANCLAAHVHGWYVGYFSKNQLILR